MKFYGDYHTHTKNSDGKGTVAENVQQAITLGFKDIAITDHGFSSVIMKEKNFYKCYQDVCRAREEFPEINILFGIENSILDADGTIDMPLERFDEFDIHILGFHYPVRIPSKAAFCSFWLPALLHGNSNKPSKELIARNTKAHIAMLQKYPVDILAHIGNHTPLDAKEVAKACSDLGTYIELNCKHLPQCERMLDDMLTTDALFIADSDAHSPSHVGAFKETESLIVKYGMEHRVVNLRENFYLRSKGREISRPTVSAYKYKK